MNAPTRPVLAIVPVERLTHRGERFHCAPLRSTMSADACLSRRAAKRDTRTGASAHLYPTCVRCPLGARVDAAVGATRKVVTCAHESGCSVVVGEVRRGLRPLCPEHRVAEGAEALKVLTAKPPGFTAARAAQVVQREAIVRPPCAVTGCAALTGHTRRDTAPWAILCCMRHRDTGRTTLREGRATEADVIAYMSEGPHAKGGNYASRLGKTRGRRVAPIDAAAVAAIVAALQPLDPAMRARVLHAASVEAARGAR